MWLPRSLLDCAGVPRDLLLARRFYDMAAGAQPDAAVAVALAKAWLRVSAAAGGGGGLMSDVWVCCWVAPQWQQGVRRCCEQVKVCTH